jgi:hypothetical protein
MSEECENFSLSLFVHKTMNLPYAGDVPQGKGMMRNGWPCATVIRIIGGRSYGVWYHVVGQVMMSYEMQRCPNVPQIKTN